MARRRHATRLVLELFSSFRSRSDAALHRARSEWLDVSSSAVHFLSLNFRQMIRQKIRGQKKLFHASRLRCLPEPSATDCPSFNLQQTAWGSSAICTRGNSIKRWCPCRLAFYSQVAMMSIDHNIVGDGQPWPVPLPTGFVVKERSNMRSITCAGDATAVILHGDNCMFKHGVRANDDQALQFRTGSGSCIASAAFTSYLPAPAQLCGSTGDGGHIGG